MNYIKRTDFYDIYIEPSRKTVVIRQKWKYNWVIGEEVSNWTYLEKKAWHQKADNVIWQQWGSKFTFWALVEKALTSNEYLHRKEFNVEFDIQWVTTNQHWTVNVAKIGPYEEVVSRVNYTSKNIYLAHIDTERRIEADINQNTLKHEFGHAIGVPDEYGKKHGNSYNPYHVDDTKALMNIGNELRYRYLRGVKKEINTMIPGVSFASFLN